MREICSIPRCGGLVRGRGLCNRHYLRQLRSGTVSKTQTRTERALEFIEDCLSTQDEKTCICPTFKSDSDYPTINLVDGRGDLRIGWVVLERIDGPKPDPTLVMRHLCGNTRCCNPFHLIWGTEKENAADRKVHGTEADRSGHKNPNSILTKDQVEEIRRRVIRGRGPYDRGNIHLLAIEYGVTRANIRMIARGATWNDNKS